MKKAFAIIALMGVFTFGMTQTMSAQPAQDEEAVDTAAIEQVDTLAAEEEVAAAETEIPEATVEDKI